MPFSGALGTGSRLLPPSHVGRNRITNTYDTTATSNSNPRSSNTTPTDCPVSLGGAAGGEGGNAMHLSESVFSHRPRT